MPRTRSYNDPAFNRQPYLYDLENTRKYMRHCMNKQGHTLESLAALLGYANRESFWVAAFAKRTKFIPQRVLDHFGIERTAGYKVPGA